jgi:isopenicillin N synthase-like dioxygenase
MSELPHAIPTIDIGPWLDQSNPSLVIEEIHSACTTYGFFQLVGHGIPKTLRHGVFEAAKTFFALPLQRKQALVQDKLTRRGYEMIGSQALNEGQAPDSKEVHEIFIGLECKRLTPE